MVEDGYFRHETQEALMSTKRMKHAGARFRFLIASAFAVTAASGFTGCTCTTCTLTGCNNPNYGKKSPNMLHAIMVADSPTSAGTNAVSTTTSVVASHGH